MQVKIKTMMAVLSVVTIGLVGCQTTYTQNGKLSEESGFSKEVFNVEKLTCWDMATIAEEDAGYAATLIYGYAQGKAGEATQTPSKIEYALSQLSRKCAGSPDKLIMSTFD